MISVEKAQEDLDEAKAAVATAWNQPAAKAIRVAQEIFDLRKGFEDQMEALEEKQETRIDR